MKTWRFWTTLPCSGRGPVATWGWQKSCSVRNFGSPWDMAHDTDCDLFPRERKLTCRNSERIRISVRSNLPPLGTSAAFGVTNASCKLQSVRGLSCISEGKGPKFVFRALWPGAGLCLPKFRTDQVFPDPSCHH